MEAGRTAGPERSGGPARSALRPAAAGLEGSAAHTAPPGKGQQKTASRASAMAIGARAQRAMRQGSKPAGPRPRSGLGSREPGARVYPARAPGLSQETASTRRHEPTSTAYSATHAIPKMGARIVPIGGDAAFSKESVGDFALGGLGKRAVECLKNKAQPAGTRIARVERAPEIAAHGEIGQSTQKQEPTLEIIGTYNRIGEKMDRF